jgi:Surface adhesin CshA non-repetitive domain 2/GEVED domain
MGTFLTNLTGELRGGSRAVRSSPREAFICLNHKRDGLMAWKAFVGVFVVMALFLHAGHVQAQYATGGSGLYKSSIFWINWGALDENVFSGKTVTRGVNLGSPASAANRLDITCTLANATATGASANTNLQVYRPGFWSGDGLDDLYNIGGVGTLNTLLLALKTRLDTKSFDYTCSATLGGVAYTLPGLVMAEAEQSAASQGEYVAFTVPSATTVRVIDQFAGCASSMPVTDTIVGSNKQIKFNGAATTCPTGGPALVGYVEGVSTGRAELKGGGSSAIGLGVFIEADYSEAIPSSYGVAAHLLTPAWSGGVAAAGVNFNNPANLAVKVASGPRLGATVLADADASGAIGGPDVDGLPKTTGPLPGGGYANLAVPVPGTTYTIPTVACTGPGAVAGWIDFNGNGVFDASEKSNVATCAGTSVGLSWAVPTQDSGNFVAQPTTYMRLRMSTLAASITDPSTPAADGEVEDYLLGLPAPPAPIPVNNAFALLVLALLMAGIARLTLLRRSR